jgi:hypothetical protein
MTDILNNDVKKFIPGFAMGITRAIISHPFEMLKLKKQMNITTNFYTGLYKGVHLSILANSIERGIQFYWFEEFKKKYSNNLYASLFASLISTSITLPYNIVLLRSTILNKSYDLNKSTLYKSSSLEYSRNITGSTIFLYCYDYFKSEKYPIYFSSIISSFIVWGITYPIDNIKNQIIANNKLNFNIMKLYRGIQYPFIRSIPSSTIGFYVYEHLNNTLNK